MSQDLFDLADKLAQEEVRKVPVKSLTEFERKTFEEKGFDLNVEYLHVIEQDGEFFPAKEGFNLKEEVKTSVNPNEFVRQLESVQDVEVSEPIVEKAPKEEDSAKEEPLTEEEYEPPTDQLQDYLRCTLGMKKYTKGYPVLGGHALITLQERSTTDDIALAVFMRTLRNENGAMNQEAVNTIWLTLQAALTISSIAVDGNEVFSSESLVGDARSSYQKVDDFAKSRIAALPPALYRACLLSIAQFNKEIVSLTLKVNDPNFLSAS